MVAYIIESLKIFSPDETLLADPWIGTVNNIRFRAPKRD